MIRQAAGFPREEEEAKRPAVSGSCGRCGGGPFPPGLLRPRRFPHSSGSGRASAMGAARCSRLLPVLPVLLLLLLGEPPVSGGLRWPRRRWPVPYR